MILSQKLKSFIDLCCRYEQFGSGQPRLDDVQHHWIKAWGVANGKK